MRLSAASSVATLERDAPFVRWAERTLHATRSLEPAAGVQLIDASSYLEGTELPREGCFQHVLWCPLASPNRVVPGGLWLARETPWSERDVTLAERLGESYGHAWCALAGGARFRPKRSWRGPAWIALALTLAVAALVPVRLSTLAPVEVVADDPTVVSAPIDGVIADVHLPPNTQVQAGELLLTLEDTTLRNQLEVAEKTLAVAEAEYRKATQAAFGDLDSGGQVAVLEKELELRRAERDYARELLERIRVTAPAAGLLVYTEKADWVGRPVTTGERIMEVADPSRVKLRIDLPVDDAIALAEGAPVATFLDVDPLNSRPATISHASYHAEMLPGDILAYAVDAHLDSAGEDVRIGLQGTAKIYGERVPVFFQVFRRPISAARQWLGM